MGAGERVGRMSIFKLVAIRLTDAGTYFLALAVGTLINIYGQFLVPLFRGDANPVATVISQYEKSPLLFIISVLIAYLFPLFVGVFSSVRAQAKLRDAVSKADFPDSKPDPVFRTATDKCGSIISAGAATEKFLNAHNFATAADVVGPDEWSRILNASQRGEASRSAIEIFVEACNEHFMVSYAPADGGGVNFYFTRTAGA